MGGGLRKKPVGLNVSLQHETGPDVDTRTVFRDVSPKPKDQIESDIATSFVTQFAQRGPVPELVQLDEADFDFLWSVEGRKAKLEFTELVLATPPYRETGHSAVIHYKPWADSFFELVNKKNDKSYRDSLPIDLLVYTTHWAYHGNEFCVQLAAERLRYVQAGSCFDQIYYLEFRGEASRLYCLKPYLPRLKTSLRREYEGMWYATVNFASGDAVPGGTAFNIELPQKP